MRLSSEQLQATRLVHVIEPPTAPHNGSPLDAEFTNEWHAGVQVGEAEIGFATGEFETLHCRGLGRLPGLACSERVRLSPKGSARSTWLYAGVSNGNCLWHYAEVVTHPRVDYHP